MANNLQSIGRPGGRLRPLLLTTLYFTQTDDVASFVPPKRAVSPPSHIKAIRSGGFGFDFDGDTAEIVDYGGVNDRSRSLDYNDRRSFLSSLFASSLLGVTAPSPAFAAKGAAEYDLEYYMRDLL